MGSTTKAIPRPGPVRNVTLPKFDFRDIAAAHNLTAANVYGGETKKRYILEMTGNGVVVFDFDNDGWQDLFFVNGTRLDRPVNTGGRLYRNREGKAFEDVTTASGLNRAGWGQGACAADFNNDGRMDLFVTYYGANALYRNLGGGRFREIPLPFTGERWSTGCALLDYDRDGDVDIFAANYAAFDLKTALRPGSNPFCYWKALAVFCGPRGMPGGQNILYRNDRESFKDASKESGISIGGLHYGLGATSSDFDDDGWPDLYVACDSTPGILYRNNRNGSFSDIAVEAGAAYGDSGQEQGSMGVSAADYDGDGRIDIVKTNFMDETATLYRNEGDRFFTDATLQSGLGFHTKFVGWGVEFLDADNDGRKDILMANGHIYPEMETAKTSETFRQSKLFYWNAGNGVFADATTGALKSLASSRGLAVGDLDNDGALEIVVVNMNAAPAVFRNLAPKGNSILVELQPAIGARVTIVAGGGRQVGEPHAGSSYASQSDLRVHFGLANRSVVDKMEIRWPDGNTEFLSSAGANQWIVVHQGKGIVARRSLRR